jgi:hypothetical protein
MKLVALRALEERPESLYRRDSVPPPDAVLRVGPGPLNTLLHLGSLLAGSRVTVRPSGDGGLDRGSGRSCDRICPTRGWYESPTGFVALRRRCEVHPESAMDGDVFVLYAGRVRPGL